MPRELSISAAWVAPVSSPPSRNAVVRCRDDGIESVGPADGQPIDFYFDNAMLLPGLVNPHTHLDLTGALGTTPPRLPFPNWLQSVIDYRATRDETQTRGDIEAGIAHCLRTGTTLIGDIASQGLSATAVEKSPLRATIFFELLGLSSTRCEANIKACDDWLRRAAGFIPAVSLHAPYSVHRDAMDFAATTNSPVAIHLAESPDEEPLLANRRGPFVPFLQSLGVYDPAGLATSFVDVIERLPDDPSTLLIHCNYLPIETPISQRTIVYCPRTHAAFGHPPHPFREFLSRGVRVVLGTDSLASNPDLSVLNEARFVAKKHPDLDSRMLLKMITAWPAESLGYRNCGALAPGNLAAFTVVQLPAGTTDPLAALFHEHTPVEAVFIGGRRIV